MITFNYRNQKHVVFVDTEGSIKICPVQELSDRQPADAEMALNYGNHLLDISCAGWAGKETRDLARAIIAAAQK